MEPINQAERKSAIAKFSFFLIFSVCLLLLPFLFFSLIPAADHRASEPVAVDTVEQADPTAGAEVRQRLATLAERMKQVNIMFLVDATEGMEQHLPAVAQAANTINQQYSAEIEAACYRDASEGAWLYMTNSMVGDDPASWIRSLDTKSKFDQDEPEALYYGLKRALESPHLAQGETNVLILVGDAGNHAQESLTDISPTDIVQLINAKKCHFAAFQARNPTTNSSYAEFSSQVMNEILDPIKNDLEASDQQEKESSDNYGTHYSFQGLTNYLLYTTKPGQNLPADELSNKISTFVDQVLNPTQQYTSSIEALANGEDISIEPELADFLRRQQFTSTELALLDSNNQ